jgi:hypothetical protein
MNILDITRTRNLTPPSSSSLTDCAAALVRNNHKRKVFFALALVLLLSNSPVSRTPADLHYTGLAPFSDGSPQDTVTVRRSVQENGWY